MHFLKTKQVNCAMTQSSQAQEASTREKEISKQLTYKKLLLAKKIWFCPHLLHNQSLININDRGLPQELSAPNINLNVVKSGTASLSHFSLIVELLSQIL